MCMYQSWYVGQRKKTGYELTHQQLCRVFVIADL